MKIKASFLLPGVVALMLAASPVISSFTNMAVAAPGHAGGRGMGFKELNLTDAQKAQMKQIHDSTRQQIDAILTSDQKEQMRLAKQQRQRPNLNLSADQKAKIKQIRQNAKSQMDALLTAEQKQKLQELRQQARQRHQQQQQK